MRIGVVSDTHGQLEFTRQAVRMLESLEVELVLHCGDIGAVEIVPLFAAWPTHFVLGNVDFNERELAQAIDEAGQTNHGRFGELELAGRRVAFLHGDDGRLLQEAIRGGGWDLVCHGHTHQAAQQRHGETLVLNPGAIYRANPHSVAVVELPAVEAHIVNLS
jgi:putative phosphoesterase